MLMPVLSIQHHPIPQPGVPKIKHTRSIKANMLYSNTIYSHKSGHHTSTLPHRLPRFPLLVFFPLYRLPLLLPPLQLFLLNRLLIRPRLLRLLRRPNPQSTRYQSSCNSRGFLWPSSSPRISQPTTSTPLADRRLRSARPAWASRRVRTRWPRSIGVGSCLLPGSGGSGRYRRGRRGVGAVGGGSGSVLV